MPIPKICVLIPSHPHVRNATHNKRLNISKYFGLKVVLNEIDKHFDIKPDLVTYEDVHRYDIVLVSMLSVDDYYRVAFTFYHRLKGKKNGYWLGGGSAVQNLAPLSEIFDTVLIGRAEGVIVNILNAIISGHKFEHYSVVHFDQYNEDQTYRINYVKNLYPEQLGKEQETMSGCKYNCAYCRYRISSLPPKMRDTDRNTTMPGNEETFWELEIPNSKPHTTSLDGFTEDIRKAVTKRILDNDIVEKLSQIAENQKNINLKVYLICGYPYNPGFDFSALRNCLSRLNDKVSGCNITIKFHITPFSAEPGTPMQWERVDVSTNYNMAMRKFKKTFGSVFVSDQISAYLLNSTMSHYSVLLRAIHHRAWLSDLPIIRAISSDPFYRSHNRTMTEKFHKLVTDFDVEPFVKEYPIGTRLSHSNISSWRRQISIERQGAKVRERLKQCGSNLRPGDLWIDLDPDPVFLQKYPSQVWFLLGSGVPGVI